MIELRKRAGVSHQSEAVISLPDEHITLKSGQVQKIAKLKRVLDLLETDNIQQIWAVHGQYYEAKLNQALTWVKEWKLVKLYLWSNRNSNIIKELEDVSFSTIIQLHVGWNKIESIEGLPFIRMPKLKQLVLRDNFITTISCLKKCEFPSLQLLCLRGNYIKEFYLQHCNFPTLKQINFNHNCFVFLAPILKTSFNHLTNLSAGRAQIVVQNQGFFEVQLMKRFPSTKRISI